MTREQVLNEIENARWTKDADEIVNILRSENMLALTDEDLKDFYCNVLCRAANDSFSKELEKWHAREIFHAHFPHLK